MILTRRQVWEFFGMKASKSSDSLSLARKLAEKRRLWAGLHTSAETLIAGLDTAPELVAMTSGRWSVVKLLALALARVGRPASVDLWTWTISRRAIGQLQTWTRAGVTCRAAVDGSLWRRQPTYGAQLLAAPLGPNVRAASLHAKAARVSGPKGSIFLAGSGNLHLSRRAELVWLSRDPALAVWLEELTDRLFAALPAGAPNGSDDERADRLARAFPSTEARPAWAAGLPVLGRV